MPDDETREALKELLAAVYSTQAEKFRTSPRASFLEAHDGKFLGEITRNKFDNKALTNPFSPYGSRFSQTSIFNQFSPYGSPFSDKSATNRFAATPPRVIIAGNFRGYLTENSMHQPRIAVNDFVYTLTTDIDRAIAGKFIAAPQGFTFQ